jgi:hypothetical protein
MKKLLSLVSLCVLSSFVFSQASLPSSYSWDGSPLPTGWTENLNVVAGATTYSGGSDASASCRLDGTGENVIVFFSNPCGAVTYYLRGTGISQPAANGTVFEIQESANGSSWTTMRSLNSSTISGSFTFYSDQPQSTSKYIRFNYSVKVSGSNIALDQVNISTAAPGSNASLELFYGSTSVPNGGTLFIGNNSNNALTLKNNGLDSTLKIFSNNISGTNAADFSLSGLPSTVATSSSVNFNLIFSAGATGSRYATLTLTDNDPFNNPYTIYLYAIGGLYATEPTSQPGNLQISNAKSYSYDLSFTNASPLPDSYIILQKNGSPITEIPADGTGYSVGDYIGQAMVAYVGTNTSFVPHHVFASSAYYYSIFSFNGPAGYQNYNTNSPLSGIAWTQGNTPGSYYNSINVLSASFVSNLTSLIYPHNQIYYSDYDITLIDKIEKRDTTFSKKVVTCVYSGYNYKYNEPWTFDTLSREHVFCHSWFPNYPASTWWGYSDLHNLFPVHQNNANGLRSNNPVGEVVNATNTFLACKKGDDAGGNTVFEPAENIKGNVARAMFYMLSCYNGDSGYNWLLPSFQDQQVLKDWNYQDPPDNYEIARNEYIQSVQGNRNPFVDHPNWACYIDFYTMTYISNPNTVCLYSTVDEKELDAPDFTVNGNGTAQPCFILTLAHAAAASMKLTDLQGKLIRSEKLFLQAGENTMKNDFSKLAPGIYLAVFETGKQSISRKIVIGN